MPLSNLCGNKTRVNTLLRKSVKNSLVSHAAELSDEGKSRVEIVPYKNDTVFYSKVGLHHVQKEQTQGPGPSPGLWARPSFIFIIT